MYVKSVVLDVACSLIFCQLRLCVLPRVFILCVRLFWGRSEYTKGGVVYEVER